MKRATCIHCGTTLYPEDHNPHAPGLCDLCQKIEAEASAAYEAEREAMRQRVASIQEQIRAAVVEAHEQHKDTRAYKRSALRQRIHTEAARNVQGNPADKEAQHAEATPAGLNYLLPGVEPIHTTPQPEGQARLL